MIPTDLYPGSKIRFVGSPASKYRTTCAMRHLEMDTVYILEKIYKSEWGYYVYLKEVPQISFRPDLFELVEAVSPPVKKRGRRKKKTA